jgi:hypothetical protein
MVRISTVASAHIPYLVITYVVHLNLMLQFCIGDKYYVDNVVGTGTYLMVQSEQITCVWTSAYVPAYIHSACVLLALDKGEFILVG